MNRSGKPRRPPGRVMVVVGAVLVVVFVVGVLAARTNGGPGRVGEPGVAAADTVASDASTVTDVAGTSAASVAEFAVGDAQAVAVDVVGRTGEVVAAGFISRRDLIESFTTPEFGPTLAAETGRAIDAMLIELGNRDVDADGLVVREQPLSASSAFVDGGVRVQVWSVLIVAAAGTGPGRQVWRTVTLDMVDRDGTWLVDGWSSTPGPTPRSPRTARSIPLRLWRNGWGGIRWGWADMWPFPNPLVLFGDAVGGVVGWAWDKVIQGIYTWFANGLLLLMEWVWSVLDTSTTPRITESWFTNGLIAPIASIAVGITLAMMLVSAIQAGLGGRPELIVDALKEGPKSLVATALTVVVMDVLIQGGDLLADVAWQAGRGDAQQVLESLAATLSASGGLAGTFLGPLSLLFGMIGLIVTTVVLFMRSSLLYLVAAFAPIVWSSSVAPMMRNSGRRLVHLVVALVLAKPAIAITLVVGTRLLANAGAAPGTNGVSAGASSLGTLFAGFTCFTIAGLSPAVIFKLLPTVEGGAAATGIAGGWGRSAMTAAQTALMVKSLGAASAASAATRAAPSATSTTGPPGAPSPSDSVGGGPARTPDARTPDAGPAGAPSSVPSPASGPRPRTRTTAPSMASPSSGGDAGLDGGSEPPGASSVSL